MCGVDVSDSVRALCTLSSPPSLCCAKTHIHLLSPLPPPLISPPSTHPSPPSPASSLPSLTTAPFPSSLPLLPPLLHEIARVVTDILFPVEQQREMSQLLKESGNYKVVYFELASIYGHDTFLIDINCIGSAVKTCSAGCVWDKSLPRGV